MSPPGGRSHGGGWFGAIVAFQAALAPGCTLRRRGVGWSDPGPAAGRPPGRQRGRGRRLGLGRDRRPESSRESGRGASGRRHPVGDVDPRRRPRRGRGHERRLAESLGAARLGTLLPRPRRSRSRSASERRRARSSRRADACWAAGSARGVIGCVRHRLSRSHDRPSARHPRTQGARRHSVARPPRALRLTRRDGLGSRAILVHGGHVPPARHSRSA
jgi:hypothetical protein